MRDFVRIVQSVSSKLEFVSCNIEGSLGRSLDRNISHVVILGWINYDPSASFILDLVHCALCLALLSEASISNGIISAACIDKFTSKSAEKSIALVQSRFYGLLIGFWKILVKHSG